MFCILIFTIGPVMAADDDHEGVTVRDGEGNDVTNENHEVVDDDDNSHRATVSDDEEEENEEESDINPEDIFSEKKVLGQDVKEGHFPDFMNVKRWVSLLFVNDYITAIVGLAFAALGLLMILLTCLSILKNGVIAAGAMLSSEGDVDEKVETVHDSERGTVALIRGVGVASIGLSFICFMINFMS